MNSKTVAALFGAIALALAGTSAAGATAQTHDPAHRSIHQLADRSSHRAKPAAENGKDASAPAPAPAQPERKVIVSVGPQAMAVQRIRDIAMAPTG